MRMEPPTDSKVPYADTYTWVAATIGSNNVSGYQLYRVLTTLTSSTAAFELESIQASAGTGAGHPYFHRQIENQRQVRAQVALDEGFQRGDAFQ